MAATHVENAPAGIDFGTTTVQVAITLAAGSGIVGGISWIHATATLDSITDNNGAGTRTWTLANNPTTAGSARSAIGYSAGSASAEATTVTATISAAATLELIVHEFTGHDTAGTLDPTSIPAAVTTDNTNPRSTSAIVPVNNGAYIFAFCCDVTDTTAPTAAGNGFTTGSVGNYCTSGYLNQAVAASATCDFTETGSPTCHQHIIGFQVAGGGGGATPSTQAFMTMMGVQ